MSEEAQSRSAQPSGFPPSGFPASGFPPSGASALLDSDGERELAMQSLERVRSELAVTAGRLRALEAERADWQSRYERMSVERDRERQRLRRLQSSESYRLGRAVVSFVKDPVRSSPRLVRGVVRRLRPRQRAGGTPAPTVAPTVAPRTSRVAVAPQRPPVHLYVAIGLEPDTLRSFVRTVSQRVLVNADHLPVVVTDSSTFSLLRTFGVVLEYLPDRHTWERHRGDMAWDDLLAQRLAQLFQDHSAVRTVIVDRFEPPGLAQLIALDATTA